MKQQPGSHFDKVFSQQRFNSLIEKQQSLEVLFDFIIRINQIDSIPEVIWHLAQHTIKALNFEDCVIYLLEEDQQTLRQAAAYGPKNPIEEKILNPITLQIGHGIVGKAAALQETILIKDTRQEPAYIVDDMLRLSELSVPILFKGKLLGVIDSEHSQLNFFSIEHQRYLEILASVLATKLSFEKNIITLESSILELEESKKLTEVYLEVSKLTYHSSSEKELYSHLRQIITKQVNTQNFFIILFDKKTQEYSFPYAHNEHDGCCFDFSLSQKEAIKILTAEVIQTQTPYLAEFEELAQRFKDKQPAKLDHIPSSWLSVPFEINSNLTGAITLQSYDAAITFNEKNKSFLDFLGQHISAAIERKLKDQKLQYQALHDQVTGLANRTLFLDRLEHAYSRYRRHSLPNLAVLFIDFDNFKLINDKFGHQAGDILLQAAAKAIQSQLRDVDTLARLGGDEFAVLLESLDNAQHAQMVAERILKVMQKPLIAEKQSLLVTISIGIALKDENTNTAEDLLRNSDHAMYHAKSLGKNSIQTYESSLHQALVYERQILQELVTAIEQDQLIFYFQPIINLENRQVTGFEALVRWQHPTRGLISPNEFIKVAEQNDLMKLIDNRLLKSVAYQLQRWQTISPIPLYISINISGQRFADSRLIDEIGQAIKEYQLRPGSLVVEVTEHTLMENIGKAHHLFHRLKALNVKISLDDFGTGYSSLNYLNQLPFDILKIDRSFVSNINECTPGQPIINMIVALANTMKIDLVAEGIETQLQLEALTQLKCRYGQGYYFSKPLPAAQAEQLLQAQSLP